MNSYESNAGSDRENFLILRGEMQALRAECEHSAKSQGQRIGALEQMSKSREDRMELLRGRVEKLDSDMRVSQARLNTIWGGVTGALVVIELFRALVQ